MHVTRLRITSKNPPEICFYARQSNHATPCLSIPPTYSNPSRTLQRCSNTSHLRTDRSDLNEAQITRRENGR
uniref:Uncharacterized protein n=1 Tax=Ascaris lumbricoides TaxID=6252 RepID=A0A0M3IAK8_ASCLU